MKNQQQQSNPILRSIQKHCILDGEKPDLDTYVIALGFVCKHYRKEAKDPHTDSIRSLDSLSQISTLIYVEEDKSQRMLEEEILKELDALTLEPNTVITEALREYKRLFDLADETENQNRLQIRLQNNFQLGLADRSRAELSAPKMRFITPINKLTQ